MANYIRVLLVAAMIPLALIASVVVEASQHSNRQVMFFVIVLSVAVHLYCFNRTSIKPSGSENGGRQIEANRESEDHTESSCCSEEEDSVHGNYPMLKTVREKQKARLLHDFACIIAPNVQDEEFMEIMGKLEDLCTRIQSIAPEDMEDSAVRARLLNNALRASLVRLEWFLMG